MHSFDDQNEIKKFLKNIFLLLTYRKDKFDHNEEVQNDWGPNMSMASMIPNVTFLLLNAFFGHRFKTTPKLLILLISLIFVIVLFAFTCAMAKIDTDKWQDAFWSVTIASIVLININAAIFQGKSRFLILNAKTNC